MPKISVIMGVYNSKSIILLKKSIESILNQTYSNFEFIICNDCSTNDEIKKILLSYSKKDSRIIVIENKKNMGLAYSLNNCLNYCKGEYIARQDDDDISLKDRFEKQINFLENNNSIDFVGSNILLINDTGIWGKQILKEKPGIDDLKYGCSFAHPALMIKKRCFDSVNGYTISKMTRRTEDYDLYFKLHINSYVGVNIQENLYLYYESKYTLSKQKFKYRIDEFFLRIHWFKKTHCLMKNFIYIFKPLFSGIIPNNIRLKQKIAKYSLNSNERVLFNEKYKNYFI